MIDFLVAPVTRVAAPDTPAPFSPPMEKYYVPDAARIVNAARRLIEIS
jgi:pyruvate/2-oxoglutarate/acetoin dehydrogenase E1 component